MTLIINDDHKLVTLAFNIWLNMHEDTINTSPSSTPIQLHSIMSEPKGRTVGSTECSWCKAVQGGTGIAVVALCTSKPPNINRLQYALQKLQNSHPILKSTLLQHTSTFSFLSSPTPIPILHLTTHDLSSNLNNTNNAVTISPLQQILELELNNDSVWRDATRNSNKLFFSSVYALPNNVWVIALRLHVAACDRTTAVLLLRELLELMMEEKEEIVSEHQNNDKKVSLAIEDLIPREKTKKPLLARGFDVLSYSLNSFRLTNLKFNDTKTTKFSQVMRLQFNQDDTKGILAVRTLINIINLFLL
jgi:hypothetical protein